VVNDLVHAATVKPCG